jgi:hypothetical protein
MSKYLKMEVFGMMKMPGNWPSTLSIFLWTEITNHPLPNERRRLADHTKEGKAMILP